LWITWFQFEATTNSTGKSVSPDWFNLYAYEVAASKSGFFVSPAFRIIYHRA
jgi:hypothetical protein